MIPTHMPLGSPLTLVPIYLDNEWRVLSCTILRVYDMSNAPPLDWGLTARSRLFLEGSDNIPTSEPSSTLYLIGIDVPFFVTLY